MNINEFLLFFLIVSIFAFNAFCMNPHIFEPPAPEGVEFGECFFVPKITGESLSTVLYSYRHICRQKFPDDEPEPPQYEKNWYFVGKLKDSETPSPNRQSLDYVQIKQLHIQFIYLKEMTVEFALRSTSRKFMISFQSVQQRNAFYGMINHDVVMSKAATNQIGALHEMMIQDQEIREIGNNVEAFREKVKKTWYITFKNEQGEPLLIFSQTFASIERIRHLQCDRLQLLFRTHIKYYILTFSSCEEAKKFSDALLKYLKIIYMRYVPADIVARFEANTITVDPQDA